MADFNVKKYYDDLARLFMGGPVVKYKIANKVAPPGETGIPVGTAKAFLKNTNNAYASTIAAYGQYNRLSRYSDYSEMESMPEIGAALSIYAEECCVEDEYGDILSIKSSNIEIKQTLDKLFYDTLNIQFNAPIWIRNLAKYGDQFLLLDHHPDFGVLGVFPMPVNEVEREEGYDPDNPLAYRYRWITQGNRILENWQVIHFRLMANDNFLPYGSAVIEPARRVWRQLILMEDAVMVYRIVRCVHGESNVWTNSGIKKIKDISVGDKVYSYDYNNDKFVLSCVKNHINNGSQKIWKIKSKHRTLKVNFNHPILVNDKELNQVRYVQACELAPKRYQLVIPNIQHNEVKKISLKQEKYEWFGFLTNEGIQFFKERDYNQSKRSLLKEVGEKLNYSDGRIKQFLYRKPNKIKGLPWEIVESISKELSIPAKFLVKYPKGMFNLERINLPEYVDEEFARFFGFMVGDGFLSSNYHACGFATGIHQNINNYYENILKKYCKKVDFHHDKRSVHECIGKFYVNSNYFSHLMEDMGFRSSVYKKRIPNWVFRSTDSIKEQFILGLMDADGWAKKNATENIKSFEIELCNKKLTEDLKELCHQLGWKVSSEIRHRHRESREIVGVMAKETDSYTIYLRCEKNDSLYENILSVEETEEFADVYDITVDNDLQNFIADGCVVHNSPERRVFYIDVGNVQPHEIPQYMKKVQGQIKQNQVVDSTTGRVDKRYNPLSTEEDYWIPKRGESSSRIETLPGGQYTGDVQDLEYLQNKLFASLKIPKSYLGYEDTSAKATLSQEDIHFAKTIKRIQNVFIAELNKIAIIHLYSAGFKESDLINFEIAMANPSTIAELQRLELWRTKFEVASMVQEGAVDRDFVYRKLFKLSDADIEQIEEGKRKDRMFDMEIEGMQPPATEMLPAPEEAPPAEVPAADQPTGLPPPPGEEAGTVTAGKDPNAQRAAPNELVKADTGKKEKRLTPDLYKYAFNLKKTAMDDKRNRSELTRLVKNPFGEEVDIEEKAFKRKEAQIKKFVEDLEKVEVFRSSREKNTKKVISD